MKNPFFSIIVPVHNVPENYLHICIGSLKNQTFKDLEIIIVDDGSGSHTAVLCDSFMQSDSRIKILHQSNRGVSVARNNGIKESTGEWILFVDADDWLEYDALKLLYSHLENNNYDILCFRAVRNRRNVSSIIDYKLNFDYTYRMSNFEDRLLLYRKAMQPPGIAKNSVSKDTFYYIWNKVYNRNFLIRNNIEFPTGIPNSEDKIFILQCLRHAEMIHSISDVLYHYRILPDSATRKFSMTIDEDRRKLLIELRDIAQLMDEELQYKGEKSYRKGTIIQDYYLFAYMIFSSIILRKYYHENFNATMKERRSQVRKVMFMEPFASAIKSISFSSIDMKDKLRLWLFRHEKYFLFVMLVKCMHTH